MSALGHKRSGICARYVEGAEPERHLRSAELHRPRASAVVAATATWLISVADCPAHGQVPAEISGGMISLGGRGWQIHVGSLGEPVWV
jgi:hypothetical protein